MSTYCMEPKMLIELMCRFLPMHYKYTLEDYQDKCRIYLDEYKETK